MYSKGTAEAFATINHKLSQLSNDQTEHCIYKVHKHLRSVNDKAYEPQIIAIGPYHRGKDNLQMMEQHKLRYFKSLLQHGTIKNIEHYISAIAKFEKRARNCFAESVDLDEADFIEMLVLDGCFLIELIRKCNLNDPSCKNDPIFQMDWIINGLHRDLILLENQIPFFVLCELYDLIEAPNQHERLIYLILYFSQSLYPGPVRKNTTSHDPREIKHWLDLIHRNWHPFSGDRNINQYYLDIRYQFTTDTHVERESRFIHSATELADANVKFRKIKSDSLFNIHFERGVMAMPALMIEDRTECFFRNLIAHEQYFPNNRFNFVISYVRLLDCLVNSAKDVEILSQCGIIDNWLGDNQVVCDIFNKLTDSVTGRSSQFVYSVIVDRVNRHYRRPWNRAMAVLSRDYFSSPWAYIAFCTAVLLLVLTVVQTVCSVLQVYAS